MNSLSLKPKAQDKAWMQLLTMAPALPQGLILVGPSGVGKRRAAKALYQWIHCKNAASSEQDIPCGICVPCRKIAENKHTDLIEILPSGENIAVDDLREMKKTLFFSPLEGKFRFVIFDEAHKMNASSANTLLKTLEEPPAHTKFFLITHERGLLLPTIVSRCQFIHFSPLPQEALEDLLKNLQIEIPEHLLTLFLDLLGGGIERASLLAEPKTLAFLESIQKVLEAGSTRWDQVVSAAEQLGPEEWKLELWLDVFTRQAHRQALAAKDPGSAYRAANQALDAAYLRRRLGRYANKKLIALAAADLTFTAPTSQGTG